MNKVIWASVFIAVLGAVGAGVYLWSKGERAQPQAPRVEAPPAPAATAAPKILYPIEGARPANALEPPATLPELGRSDEVLSGVLSGLFGRSSVAELFYLDRIVHRFVATIDNLPRKDAAVQVMPVRPARGRFATVDAPDGVTIGPDNAARYAPYVRLVEAADAEKLVTAYARYYPLFQQAYVELGYPTGYFNDRLIQVIDHLVATPDVRGPFKVVQPKVMYKFADPELEALSTGQKALVRMGPENAAKVKAKLREIRNELAGERPKR